MIAALAVEMGGGGQVAQEPRELQLGEELAHRRLVDHLAGQGLGLLAHRQVVLEQDQLARRAHRLDVFLEPGAERLGPADVGGRHLVQPGDEALDVAELLNQRGRRLGPDLGNPGDVVDGVAHERHVLHDLVRAHADALGDVGEAGLLLGHGVVELHVLVDELHQVLVAGDDAHVEALRHRVAGGRSDHVVGLVAGRLQRRDVEGLDHVAHQRELRDQVVGRRRPVRLVVGVDGLPEDASVTVPGDGDVRRLPVAQRLEQHVGEAVDRVGGHPLAVREVGDRVVGAEDVGAAVDESQEGSLGRHGGAG